jgi:hypothetical protein
LTKIWKSWSEKSRKKIVFSQIKILKMNPLKSLFTALFLINAFFAYAQTVDLKLFNERRVRDTKTDMMILGGWALSNMAVSGILLANTEGGVSKGFHQMNIGWNAVNLTIAGVGYLAAMKSNPATLDLFGTVNEHYKLQRLFLFNAGLDVGYMAAGAYVMERSKSSTKNPEQMKGFGQAIVVNGAFLFVFDLANYFIQSGHNDKIKLLLNSNGMGMSFHF